MHVQIARVSDYMFIASEIRRVLHEHGIHSATIQPEYSREDGELVRHICTLLRHQLTHCFSRRTQQHVSYPVHRATSATTRMSAVVRFMFLTLALVVRPTDVSRIQLLPLLCRTQHYANPSMKTANHLQKRSLTALNLDAEYQFQFINISIAFCWLA